MNNKFGSDATKPQRRVAVPCDSSSGAKRTDVTNTKSYIHWCRCGNHSSSCTLESTVTVSRQPDSGKRLATPTKSWTSVAPCQYTFWVHHAC